MRELDDILQKYTNPATGTLHGAAFVVVDESGRIIYENAAGLLKFNCSHVENRMKTDSLCWIASMSKVITAVAVMQLVERGLVKLDDDVRDYVTELKDLCVLRGIENEQPITENIEGKITIRTYVQWESHKDGYRHPLVFQPGQSWGYGSGIDWAGRMVENVTKATLEDYMIANIWSPLGMGSTTFHPEKRSATLPAELDMALRSTSAEGKKHISKGTVIMKYPLDDNLGGIGLFSTATDFIKFLSALLRGGGPVLRRSSVDLLFSPQLDATTHAAMPKGLGVQSRRILGFRNPYDAEQADHTLGGTITLKDIPGRRRKGTVSWAGLPNLHWWIDRKTGIAATLFTQLIPPGDAGVADLLLELETAVYRGIQADGSPEFTPKI